MDGQQFTPAELASEEWRPVVGYEGLYEVSSLGRVRSPSKRGTDGRRLRPRPRRPYPLPQGYLVLNMWRDGACRKRSVHRLVCEAFHGPPPPEKEVNHKNGIRHDNRAENLEWVTKSENHRHSWDSLGRRNGQERAVDVFGVLAGLAAGATSYAVATAFGTSYSVVRRIARGQHWSQRRLARQAAAGKAE